MSADPMERRIYFGRIVGSPPGLPGWRNDRHIARFGCRCANFRVNSCRRAEYAVGSRQLVAEGLGARIGGRGALRRDGALLRHRLRGHATRRIPRGCWRGCLSGWRHWRRRSLRGCGAGRHHNRQDQKKRFSLHRQQMLQCYRCSLPPTGVFGLPARWTWFRDALSGHPRRASG